MPVIYTPDQEALFHHDPRHWSLDNAQRGIWIHRSGFKISLLKNNYSGVTFITVYSVKDQDNTPIARIHFPKNHVVQPGIKGVMLRLQEVFSTEHRRLMDVFVDAAVGHCLLQSLKGDYYVRLPALDDPDGTIQVIHNQHQNLDDQVVMTLPDSLLPLARQICWVPTPRDASESSSPLVSIATSNIHLILPSCMHTRMALMAGVNVG